MASQAITAKQLINKLKHEREKHMCAMTSITFNKSCKRKNVVPNYIKIDIKNQSDAAQKTLKQSKVLWLNNEIKSQYKKLNESSIRIKSIKKDLKNVLTNTEFENVISKINSSINTKRDEKIRITNAKLNKLVELQNKSFDQAKNNVHEFYPRVVNLTEIVFNDDEHSMLGKLSKYNPPVCSKDDDDLKNLIIETEVAISYIDSDKQSKVRYEAARKIENIISKSKARRARNKIRFLNDKSTIKEISNKISDKEAKVVEADKSNATVVIYEADLDSKVRDFINKNEVLEINDKTKEFNKAIKDLLDNNSVIPPNKIRGLYNAKAAPPLFKPLVKTHKDNMPIRPVINSVCAPSYKISKYLAALIKNNIDIGSENTSKNSVDFIEKLKKCENVHKHLFLTMDVDNMYANIPREEAVQVLISRLKDSGKFSDCEIKDIGTIVEEITKQNYFIWKNKYYYDTKGLPMGGPLSALLAELYLQKYENDEILSNKNPHKQRIVFYNRYVDDCFISFRGTKRQAKLFVNHLNKINSPIKFKLEVEEYGIINFLDIKINKTDNEVEFGIFRKPTQTDLVIPKDSNHPHQYKLASFRSMINRLLTYQLSQQEFEKEKKIIKTIAFNNGFNPYIIDDIIRKTKFKLVNKQPASKKIGKFIPFRYVNKYSETIGNIFKNNSISPAYKIPKGPSFNQDKTQLSKADSRGVYLIECNKGVTCNKKYIGSTNRTFLQRFKEHNASNQTNPSSKVAQHLKQNNSHKIDFDKSLTVLKKCNDGKKAQVWEEYFIYNSVVENGKINLLNKKEDFSDKVTFKILQQLNQQ